MLGNLVLSHEIFALLFNIYQLHHFLVHLFYLSGDPSWGDWYKFLLVEFYDFESNFVGGLAYIFMPFLLPFSWVLFVNNYPLTLSVLFVCFWLFWLLGGSWHFVADCGWKFSYLGFLLLWFEWLLNNWTLFNNWGLGRFRVREFYLLLFLFGDNYFFGFYLF